MNMESMMILRCKYVKMWVMGFSDMIKDASFLNLWQYKRLYFNTNDQNYANLQSCFTYKYKEKYIIMIINYNTLLKLVCSKWQKNSTELNVKDYHGRES